MPEILMNHAGIVDIDDPEPGIPRRKLRHGWGYFDPAGQRITDRAAHAAFRDGLRLRLPRATRYHERHERGPIAFLEADPAALPAKAA